MTDRVQRSAQWCGDRGEQNTQRRWCMSEYGWRRRGRKWWILTYCCRNVSVCRVIGIHIGRVMGRGEHSVVVDSESWQEQKNNRKINHGDSHQYRHKGGDTREQWEQREWEGRAAQVWDRVMLSCVHSGRKTPHIMLRSIPDPSTTFNTSSIKRCTNITGKCIYKI